MHIDDAEVESLKKWIVKKLEDISDADSDVLADYVLALLRAEDSDEEVRQNCMDNLKDFLREGSEKFVQELFEVVDSKSYLPNYVPPSLNPPDPRLSAAIGAAPFNPPTGPSFNPPTGPAAGVNGRGLVNFGQSSALPGQAQINNRKRTYDDHEADNGYDNQMLGNTSERAPKQPRHHSRTGGRGGNNGVYSPAFGHESLNGLAPQAAVNSQFPLGFPALDPNNPMSAIMAMQAILPLLGIPQPQLPVAQGNISSRGRGRRCRDYDLKGFCARGSTCPYEHGTDSIVVPTGINGNEAPPFNQMMPVPFAQGTFPMSNGSHSGSPHNSSGHSRQSRAGGRAPFSAKGKNYDKSITTIVVENIPEDYFAEEEVREYFSQFGNILEIDMQPYKRLALVKYEDYYSAQRAHASPKTIFENRFVKVFWYKPDQASNQTKRAKSDGQNSTQQSMASQPSAEPEVDPAEIEKRIADAQKAYEERQKKQQEAKAQKDELEAKMQEQAAARKSLLEAIVDKERQRNGAAGFSETEASLKEAEESEVLRTKLALLEAEAQSLGIDPNDAYSAISPSAVSMSPFAARGRGRGAMRARGSYFPRGRGSYRGWGYAPRATSGGGSVMRLDNRPKKVAVIGVAAGAPQDEELRQYLFQKFESDSLEIGPHPERSDSQVISFNERYMAESFVNDTSSEVLRLKLSWYKDPVESTNGSADAQSSEAMRDIPHSEGTSDIPMSDTMNETSKSGPSGSRRELGEVEQGDLDVAEDDDRWMR